MEKHRGSPSTNYEGHELKDYHINQKALVILFVWGPHVFNKFSLEHARDPFHSSVMSNAYSAVIPCHEETETKPR